MTNNMFLPSAIVDEVYLSLVDPKCSLHSTGHERLLHGTEDTTNTNHRGFDVNRHGILR